MVDARTIALGEIEQQESLLRLPVLLDETQDLLSGQMRIAFDPEAYRVVRVTPAEATSDFLVVSNAVDGELSIAFAGARASAGGGKAILQILLERQGSGSSDELEIEEATLNGGTFRVDIAETAQARARVFALLQNWPNPFNPETTLRYELPEASPVRLEIFDMLGQRVRLLVQEYQDAGRYEVQWDGLDESGREMASGLYVYRLQAGAFSQVRKMTLLR